MRKKKAEPKVYSSARSGRGRKRVVLAPPLLIYVLFSISILLQIPAGYVIHHISFTFGMLLNQIGTLLIPVFIVIKFFNLSTAEVLPFKGVKATQVFLSIIMILFLAVITDYLIFVTEWALPVGESLDNVYKEMMKVTGTGSYIHKFLILCILPSICEELFFRGFCQTGLTKYYGKTTGIFITAAIFAIAHLSPWYTHLYFLLGILLSWLFATTGSLWIPIICHIVNNTWTFTIHVTGWTIPLKGDLVWWNPPVLVIASVVLVGSIYFWNRSVKTGGYKSHGPQPLRRP